ncbi:M20/M25/M40 family metallo-hydrolase [Listeria rocourtiae]|uniref:M20/M25/M40 family metallo-hydrolase n=1 Tax=Listeria rocourtiae TaxID=647910 RepID=UPI001629DD35|nr:M20/M25/M40 family metallo-hydrolase [Listeria rocourtiae]MBC1434212.1 M20/M25/M40 family metallo-hydrolase [Listeria rocourtiae]MBC1603737.1 M20/M25/M40 family metallo-hydrolase [Listeria rocourtiae]
MTQAHVQELFLELVAIPSKSGQEQEIMAHIQTFFKKIGIEVKTSKQQAGLVATIPATNQELEQTPVIAFSAHLDTATSVDPPEVIITNGYIETANRALLGADDKAGVAAMLAVAKYLSKNAEPHGQVEFIFTTKEEEGLIGAKLFDLDLVDATFGYCLDAPGSVGGIIHTSKTHLQLDFWIEVAMPHEKSAIQIARDAMKKIHKNLAFRDGIAWQVYHFGGEILENGNEKVTILSEFSADYPLKNCLLYVDQIKQIFIETGVTYKADVQDVTHMSYHYFSLTEKNHVYKIASKAMQALEITPKRLKLEGGTDANVFNDRGIPFIVLSAGFENPHTTSERIASTELDKLTKLILEIIKITAN